MKKRAFSEEENERRTRRCTTFLLCLTFLLLLTLSVKNRREANNYRKAIYEAEREGGVIDAMDDTCKVVRLIGKPSREYWQLPATPKYRHFWDAF